MAQLQSQLAQTESLYRQGVDDDWRRSCAKYPEVLDYYFSLVEVSVPEDAEPRVREPRFGVPGGGGPLDGGIGAAAAGLSQPALVSAGARPLGGGRKVRVRSVERRAGGDRGRDLPRRRVTPPAPVPPPPAPPAPIPGMYVRR